MATSSRAVMSSGAGRCVRRTERFWARKRVSRGVRSRSRRSVLPPMGGRFPAIVARSVDLPEPFGPASTTISPERTESVMSGRTTVAL